MLVASAPRPRCLEPSSPLALLTSPKNPWHCFQRCLTSARRPPMLVVGPHRFPAVPPAYRSSLLLQRARGSWGYITSRRFAQTKEPEPRIRNPGPASGGKARRKFLTLPLDEPVAHWSYNARPYRLGSRRKILQLPPFQGPYGRESPRG